MDHPSGCHAQGIRLPKLSDSVLSCWSGWYQCTDRDVLLMPTVPNEFSACDNSRLYDLCPYERFFAALPGSSRRSWCDILGLCNCLDRHGSTTIFLNSNELIYPVHQFSQGRGGTLGKRMVQARAKGQTQFESSDCHFFTTPINVVCTSPRTWLSSLLESRYPEASWYAPLFEDPSHCGEAGETVKAFLTPGVVWELIGVSTTLTLTGAEGFKKVFIARVVGQGGMFGVFSFLSIHLVPRPFFCWGSASHFLPQIMDFSA
uniref:Uncharacterized protein n=1 Tax=Fagus sylvatica TaxID=28930 RepID=A0A2N9ETC7_FAGSY